MMALVRRNPWRNLSFLQDQINRMFWEAFPEPRGEEDEVCLGTWYPSVDIHETDEAIVIQAELPGLEKEDIVIEIKENILTLKGERTEDRETKEENYYRQERRSGKFHRSFTLPAVIDPGNAVAKYKAGVLEVKIPKTEEQKPKEIEIK
jgi:HSP20 family protein